MTLRRGHVMCWSLAVRASAHHRARRAGTSKHGVPLCAVRCTVSVNHEPQLQAFLVAGLLAPVSAAEQTCSHCAPSPSLHSVPSLSLSITLFVCLPAISCRTASRSLLVSRPGLPSPSPRSTKLGRLAQPPSSVLLALPVLALVLCPSALQVFVSCSSAVLRA